MQAGNKYYLSLNKGLKGYYVAFDALCEEDVIKYAQENFGQIWGAVFSGAYFREILRRRYPNATKIINRGAPINLVNGDSNAE